MKILPLLGLPLIISGCTSNDHLPLPEVLSHNSPVEAHNNVQGGVTSPALRGFTRRPIVEPQSWKSQNVAPKSVKGPGS